MLRSLLILSLSVTLLGVPGSVRASGGEGEATVSVECSRSSGLILINITNHRRIGKVKLELKDANGRTLYLEEGKALTEELVRRLDKGMFPRGEATLTVTARDFTVTQHFTIQ